MKKYYLYAICIALSFNSCNYLDVEPEKKGTLEEAFATENSARNFLYACYSFMPLSSDHNGEPQQNGASDETALTSQWASTWHFSKIVNVGAQTATNPIYNYWSSYKSLTQPSRCKAYDLYSGIRQCYTFLNRIDNVPDINTAEKEDMKAQSKFLIAYYHYLLLRLYGPIVLIDEEMSLNVTGDKLYPKRRPYDECVQWISDRFDEVIPLLPTRRESDKYGAPTRIVAEGIKARMLLYAASPLFNGNSEYYSDFKNKDGEQLINLTYDKEKWKKAMDAAMVAIDDAEKNGHALYTNLSIPDTYSKERRGYFNHRWNTITKPNEGNTDILWAYTNGEVNFQSMMAARGLSAGSVNVPYGGIAPSMQMVETYLTRNGLPLDKDPEFNYSERYAVVEDENGEKTTRLHLNREPRFYADIAYDRATNYELDGKDNLNGGQGYTLYMRLGEINPVTGLTNGNDPLRDGFTPNGYLLKKYIHPNTAFRNNKITQQSVAMPLLRLTELYLNYAEAYYEYYGKLNGKALEYINAIREHAGIPDVDTSWRGIPGRNDREIIRIERTIELMFEGHRFFDARRWKIAHLTFSKVQKRWNCVTSGYYRAKTQPAEDYLVLKDSNEPSKTFNVPQHYLYPIDARDIDINPNLVQNPGW
uniref:RagB/SusD family nutrient uptake outer membrane protein n=1 Tax=Prevotella sp. GTC17260 TaxID=3236796 RepID=A0AB33JGN2_9BACT